MEFMRGLPYDTSKQHNVRDKYNGGHDTSISVTVHQWYGH